MQAKRGASDMRSWRNALDHQGGDAAVVKFSWLLMVLLLSAGPVSADIFKCVGKNALVVYQNFPCEIDSLGTAPPEAKGARGAGALNRPDATAKPATATPVAAVKTAAASTPSVPQLGMTSEQVKAIWGEPLDVLQDEPRSGGRIEIWQYADGRSVQLDHRQRVLSVQQ
jgi:hypothetical protein